MSSKNSKPMFLKFESFAKISSEDFVKLTYDFIGEAKAKSILIKYLSLHKKEKEIKNSKLYRCTNVDNPKMEVVMDFCGTYIYNNEHNDETLLYEYEQKILRTLLKSQNLVGNVDYSELEQAIENYPNFYFKALLEVLFLNRNIPLEKLEELRNEAYPNTKKEKKEAIALADSNKEIPAESKASINEEKCSEKEEKTNQENQRLKEENDKLQKLNDSYQQELAKLKEKFVSYIQMGTSLKVKDFPDMTKENLLLLIEEIKEKTDKGDYEAAESMILKSYVFVRFLEDEK